MAFDDDPNYATTVVATTVGVSTSMIYGIAKFLGNTKNTEGTVAVNLNDINGTFIAGFIMDKETDEDGKMSFNISFTLDEEDVKDINTVWQATSKEVMIFVNTFLKNRIGNHFAEFEVAANFFRVLFVNIVSYYKNLTKSDIPSEGLDVHFGDAMTLKISYNKNKREVALVPGAGMKTFIKNDKFATIEVDPA